MKHRYFNRDGFVDHEAHSCSLSLRSLVVWICMVGFGGIVLSCTQNIEDETKIQAQSNKNTSSIQQSSSLPKSSPPPDQQKGGTESSKTAQGIDVSGKKVSFDSQRLNKGEEEKVLALLRGDWVLVSYFLLDKNEYIEVPITPEPLELVESWSFRKGSYRRIMDKNLSFSAKYSVYKAPYPQKAIEGTPFLLRAQNVVSSVPGIRRAEEFFYGEVAQDRVVFFYLGQNFADPSPKQGHLLERK